MFKDIIDTTSLNVTMKDSKWDKAGILTPEFIIDRYDIDGEEFGLESGLDL